MKVKINRVWILYLMVLSIVLEGRSVYSVVPNVLIRNIPRLIMAFCMTLYMCFTIFVRQKEVKFRPLLVLYILIQFPMILNSYNDKLVYFFYFVLLVPVLVLICKEYKEKIALIYCNVIVFLSLVSLFYYFFGSVLKWLQPTNTLLIQWGGQYEIEGWIGLYYQIQQFTFFNSRVVRNSSIFTEPAVYGTHLLIALVFLTLEKNQKKKKYKYIILFLACMTSFSTSGIVAFMIVSWIYFFKNFKANDIQGLSNKLIIGVASLGIVFFIMCIMISSKYNSRSWIERTSDYVNVLQAIKGKRLFGMGYGTSNSTEDAALRRLVLRAGRSNILGAILLDGGFYMMCLFIAPILYVIKEIRIKFDITIMLLIISYGMILLYAPMPYSFLVCFIWSFLYSKRFFK